MTTPDFRALCAELLQAWQFGDDIAGPMNRARAALEAEPEGEGPSETDLYDLAEMFNGDPVPAMRRALELWGNPLQEAPATAAPATPPAPEPGDVEDVAQWLHAHALDCRVLGRDVLGNDWAEQCTRAATLLQQQQSELATLPQQPHPTFQDAIKLAQGCHDYSGGHSGAEGEAWHGAIGMVVDVLKRAAIGPWDSQTRAVYGVGVEAQAGEVEA
jgi:hypothetical protein